MSSWWSKRKKKKTSDPKIEKFDEALERMTKTENGMQAESTRLRARLAQIRIDVEEKEKAALAEEESVDEQERTSSAG